jgi:hypothetical protein
VSIENLFQPQEGTAVNEAAPEETTQEVVPQETQEDAPAAPSQEDQEKHVPLAALEAERKGRQDWKEKAIRAEEELKALRAQYQQPQQPQQQQIDPLQAVQQQVINERFNMSEMLVRQQYQDADEKVQVFMEAARSNPALAAALQTQRHPWEFAYKEGARMLMLKEVGDDPAQYREKLKAELMAEIQKSNPAPAPALNLPQSLNGARSVAPRSAQAFTGPTPLDQLFQK